MSKPVNQTINAPVVGDISGGVVHVSNTVNHHQHTHHHQHSHQHQTIHAHGPVYVEAQPEGFALQPPPAPPARTPKPKRPAYDLSPAMREALALMRPLPKPVRIDLLTWMRCEFGTGMVAELEPRELYRLRAHVLEVRQRVNLS